MRPARIAVLIPCRNEQAAIGKVLADVHSVLPDATAYVYDNGSDDQTATIAAAAGSIVRREPRAGKGNVVRRMFADVDADVYLLIDGDDTYDLQIAPLMIRTLISENLDMVSAARVSASQGAFRTGHRMGNLVLTHIVRSFFGRQFRDMLTGYRAFSRRFVKSFPAHSQGFEIETELTVHALQMRIPSSEIQATYSERPLGSESKLETIRDGLRILRMIGLLVRDERPLQFFGVAGLIAAIISMGFGMLVLIDFLHLRAVPRFPTLIVVVGLFVISLLSVTCGLILDTISRLRLEQKRLYYLSHESTDSIWFESCVEKY